MSYQAITDILVNPKLQEAQLSTTIKDSPKLTSDSSTSFADLVSFYKQNEQTEKTSDSSVNKSEEQAKVPEENKSSETSEKVDDKKSIENEKSEKTDQTEKKEKSEIVEEKTVKSEEKFEISDGKNKKIDNSKKEKKLDDKDFARLSELTENIDVEKNQEVNVAAVLNQQEMKTKVGEKVSSDEEFVIPENTVEIAAENVVNAQSDVENEASDFDFSNKGNQKKEFTLDKEGKITVQDLRTEVSEEDFDNKTELKVTEIKQTSENTATITMDLNATAQADVLSLNNQTAGSNGSNFQAMLNNQIQTSAPEFVKAGNLILKDNNQGTINLVLHPDDLGNVKIHMTLDGKTISGQITVATKEALQVFKDNAETLREAFIKSGFENASFDVALNNGGQFNQNMEFAQQNDGTELFAKKVYSNSGAGLNSDLENIMQNVEDNSNYSVNIVA